MSIQAPAGNLGMRVVQQGTMISPEILIRDKWIPEELEEIKNYNPKTQLGKAVREIFKYLPREAADAARELITRLSSCVVIESKLSIRVFKAVPWHRIVSPLASNLIEDYGVVGEKVVTTAGVGFLVDAWQNLLELETMKYHALGTNSGAESSAETALGTELTTEYTGNVRATGSLTEGATANVFRSVGSNVLDGTPGAALREHGLFSASTVGVLWDRTLFAAITLVSGDTLESTYDVSFVSGS